MQSMALFCRLESNGASITGNLHFVNISSVLFCIILFVGFEKSFWMAPDCCSFYLGMQKKKKSEKNGSIKCIVLLKMRIKYEVI